MQVSKRRIGGINMNPNDLFYHTSTMNVTPIGEIKWGYEYTA